jgi:hypothetical protein
MRPQGRTGDCAEPARPPEPVVLFACGFLKASRGFHMPAPQQGPHIRMPPDPAVVRRLSGRPLALLSRGRPERGVPSRDAGHGRLPGQRRTDCPASRLDD